MDRKTLNLANSINNHCKEYQFFYAYGTVKQTIKAWSGDNRKLLCKEAQTMADQINERESHENVNI